MGHFISHRIKTKTKRASSASFFLLSSSLPPSSLVVLALDPLPFPSLGLGFGRQPLSPSFPSSPAAATAAAAAAAAHLLDHSLTLFLPFSIVSFYIYIGGSPSLFPVLL